MSDALGSDSDALQIHNGRDVVVVCSQLLQVSWNRWWAALGAQGDGHALMQKVVAAYAEPQRHYHTRQHLVECLALLSEHSHAAREPAEIEAALWFHDAVYDVMAHDNEARSAAWALEALGAAGVGSGCMERIRSHILATRHAALPQGQDQQLLVDIDLAILGASRLRFDEYEAQVQAEYAWVEPAVFRHRRAAVLLEFLARKPIYQTAALREVLENQARRNLAYSLEKLRTVT